MSETIEKRRCSKCKEEKRRIEFLDDKWVENQDRRRCKLCSMSEPRRCSKGKEKKIRIDFVDDEWCHNQSERTRCNECPRKYKCCQCKRELAKKTFIDFPLQQSCDRRKCVECSQEEEQVVHQIRKRKRERSKWSLCEITEARRFI